MVPAGNKAKSLSLVKNTTKTIHHYHHHHENGEVQPAVSSDLHLQGNNYQ